MNGKELNEIEEDMKRHNAEYAERVASPFPDTAPLILDTFCTRFEHPPFLKALINQGLSAVLDIWTSFSAI